MIIFAYSKKIYFTKNLLEKRDVYFFQNASNWAYVIVVLDVIVAFGPNASNTQARNRGSFQYSVKSIS